MAIGQVGDDIGHELAVQGDVVRAGVDFSGRNLVTSFGGLSSDTWCWSVRSEVDEPGNEVAVALRQSAEG